jgi:hypothetical protein
VYGIEVCCMEAVIFGPYYVPHNHDMDCGILILQICVTHVFISSNCIYIHILVIDQMS